MRPPAETGEEYQSEGVGGDKAVGYLMTQRRAKINKREEPRHRYDQGHERRQRVKHIFNAERRRPTAQVVA